MQTGGAFKRNLVARVYGYFQVSHNVFYMRLFEEFHSAPDNIGDITFK